MEATSQDLQDVSRQKSHGFVLQVYVHHARDFCYTWIWVKKLTDIQVSSGVAEDLCQM